MNQEVAVATPPTTTATTELVVPSGGADEEKEMKEDTNNTRTTELSSQPMVVDAESIQLPNPAVGNVAVPRAATIALNYKATKAPKETLEAVYKAGEYKAGLPLNLLMMQSFMAGIYIAMAGQLYLTVGGGVLGASLFPTGLIAVVLTSAELFTGDSLVFCASVLGQRVSFTKLIRNWTVAWIMNFIGCIFWAGL
mmetsp:Transcript_33228/g.55617  ORF Transcript_33228/g.55617 Transcript_33228/m.55617 type:complete len:195 (+) Transcript_33228:133-717(+)